MDHADPRLEGRPDSIYHPVRGADPSGVNNIPFTQKFGHALRRLTRGQPQRRCGMATLVRSALLEPQMTQQRVPDPVGDVLVVERLAEPVREDVLAKLPRGLVLRTQRVEDDLTHLDVALTAVRLGVLLLPCD